MRTLGINEEQEQPERQLVNRKLLPTLSTGASCQRQARYSTAYAEYGREVPADIQAPLSLFFRRRSILKLFRRLTMAYVLPGTPLDINQKTRVLWQSLSLLSLYLRVNGTGIRDNPAYVRKCAIFYIKRQRWKYRARSLESRGFALWCFSLITALHTGNCGTNIVWFLIYDSKFTTIL